MHSNSPSGPTTPDSDDAGSRAFVARRDLLRLAGAAALGAVAVPLLPGAAQASTGPRTSAAASTFAPLRPPATPLIVRSPYLSCWQAADELAGTWSTFWNGHITALCGIARIDGTPYLFAGSPGLPSGPTLTLMNQVSLEVTATRSTYVYNGGGVNLTVEFLSPVDPNNLQRQCVPFGYVTIHASSADAAAHDVQVYFDISGEWAHGNTSADLSWSQATTSSTIALTNTATAPSVLAEYNDQASWGTVVVASPTSSQLTWQIGQDVLVRAQAASHGVLLDTEDSNQPRPISTDWPVFAFCHDFGSVAESLPGPQFQVVIGHVRTPAVSYLGTDLAPWWTTYWSSWQDMVDWFVGDYNSALSSATALDQQIQTDATNAAGAQITQYTDNGTPDHLWTLIAQ